MRSVAGAGVVVTGAGSGIGAALARRFAAEGARVVVNDINAAAAAEVAASCDGAVVPGDAASERGVARLIGTAQEVLGAIDLYCANAGVARGGDQDAAEPDWDISWQVNVMAHVRAARLLTGPWLGRGSGHLICTATYQHRGIVVQAICPQGVRTPLLDSAGAIGQTILGGSAITPEAVADAVIEGIADGRFLILPHPEVARMYAGRAAEPDRWLHSMNKIQRRVEELS